MNPRVNATSSLPFLKGSTSRETVTLLLGFIGRRDPSASKYRGVTV